MGCVRLDITFFSLVECNRGRGRSDRPFQRACVCHATTESKLVGEFQSGLEIFCAFARIWPNFRTTMLIVTASLRLIYSDKCISRCDTFAGQETAISHKSGEAPQLIQFTAEQAFNLRTVHGAGAMRMASELGSLAKWLCPIWLP